MVLTGAVDHSKYVNKDENDDYYHFLEYKMEGNSWDVLILFLMSSYAKNWKCDFLNYFSKYNTTVFILKTSIPGSAFYTQIPTKKYFSEKPVQFINFVHLLSLYMSWFWVVGSWHCAIGSWYSADDVLLKSWSFWNKRYWTNKSWQIIVFKWIFEPFFYFYASI